jgi:hypothetical protein
MWTTWEKLLVYLVLGMILGAVLSGCTLKFNGEWSVMKQWDRPVEAVPQAKEPIK